MIQALQKVDGSVFNYARLNLTDIPSSKTSILTLGYRPLISAKSQQTNKEKNFLPFFMGTTKSERYIELLWLNAVSGEDASNGVIVMGDDEFPYGFYDITIYSNTSNTNLSPTLAGVDIYNGLLNLTQQNNVAVQYTSYEENDSDTDSIYITNTMT